MRYPKTSNQIGRINQLSNPTKMLASQNTLDLASLALRFFDIDRCKDCHRYIPRGQPCHYEDCRTSEVEDRYHVRDWTNGFDDFRREGGEFGQ